MLSKLKKNSAISVLFSKSLSHNRLKLLGLKYQTLNKVDIKLELTYFKYYLSKFNVIRKNLKYSFVISKRMEVF